MCSLQLLFRVIPATLLLIFCLHLETNKAQENTSNDLPLTTNVQISSPANGEDDVSVAVKIQSNLKEPMVIKSYLRSNITMATSFNFIRTFCLSPDFPTTSYWDFPVDREYRTSPRKELPTREGEVETETWLWNLNQSRTSKGGKTEGKGGKDEGTRESRWEPYQENKRSYKRKAKKGNNANDLGKPKPSGQVPDPSRRNRTLELEC
ncbi:Prolactin-inducible protein like protein [Tupaia chinensis]|uniref:Prolactin-inducible protein like protein n=1 Tax=Tupaia chinensis TaxID=246437 RepID=L9L1J2_TUPCH|nr:Prolactin-inducible protein like protein [Tupaia chinensis]